MRLIVAAVVAGIFVLPVLVLGRGAAGFGPAAGAAGGLLVFGFAVLLLAVRSGSPRARSGPRPGGGRDRLFLSVLLLIAFVVRVAAAALIDRLGVFETIAPDEETFHANGHQFALWLAGDSPYRLSYRFLDSLQIGYYYFVGAIYYLFGVERFLPVLANCIFGSLAVLPVYGIAKDLGGREAGRPAALLVAFFPSVLLWSTLLIRDSLVILVLLLVIREVMVLRRTFTMRRAIWLVVLLVALASLRQYLFVIVAAAAGFSVLLGRAGRTGRSFAAGMAVILLIIAVMKVGGYGLGELERASLAQLNLHRQFNAVPGAAGTFAPHVDISKPEGALTWLPVGMLYFLGSPFPWQVLSPRQILALPDVLAWYLLLPAMLTGLSAAIRRSFRDASMLLVTITLVTILYSLVEGNVGIIFRHRAQVIAPMMVFAGMGFAIRAARRAERQARDAAGAALGRPAGVRRAAAAGSPA